MYRKPSGEATVDRRPLIAHVIFRLGVGGLENGVVNLVNRMPAERFRHAIVCLKDFTEFRQRVSRSDVEVHAIHKKEGHDLSAQWRLYRLFRRLRPAVVHTRNYGCLEALMPAWLAGVPARVHGEHGWDVFDPEGRSRKHQILRRAHQLLVDRYVPLSREIETYLHERVGLAPERLTRIYNGVDTTRFHPPDVRGTDHSIDTFAPLPAGFLADDSIVLGTVGRMHGVKDQENLTHAFIRLCDRLPEQARRLRLVMIGDGPLREVCEGLLNAAGLSGQAWLPGARDDVPELLRAMTIFVLPSRAEGISNTILEAMASGLPVVATAVGGNSELIVDGETGRLVPRGDPDALASALAGYVLDPDLRHLHGRAARQRVEQQFSLEGMMRAYTDLYAGVIQQKAPQLLAAVGPV
jgi:sugar transferase (PEP-CTERM/EpsH1 system associated)